MADLKINHQTGEVAVPQADGGYRIFKSGEYKFNAQTNEYATPTDSGGWEIHQGRGGPTKDAAAALPKEEKAGFLPFKKNLQTGEVSFDPTAGVLGALISGATLPGDVAAGKVNPESPEGIQRMMDFTAMATPIGPGVRAAESAIPGTLKSLRVGQPKTPTAQELKAAGAEGFEQARGLGVDYSADAVKSMADDITRSLAEDGFAAEITPKTFSILSKLREVPEVEPGAAALSSLDNLVALRKTLQKAAGDSDPAERAAASRAIEAVDDFIARADPQSVVAGPAAAAAGVLDEARANYAAGMRSDKVTAKAERAELDADAANSGLNLDNRTRQVLKSIIDPERPQNARGYSKEELALINDIVRGKYGVNAARWLGNFLGGGGGMAANLGGLGSAALGFQLAGPWGMALGAVPPIAGFAARQGAIGLTKARVKALDNAIRQRSPLYQKAAETPPMLEGLRPEIRAAINRGLMLSVPSISQGPMNAR